jgi:hypothetical protein
MDDKERGLVNAYSDARTNYEKAVHDKNPKAESLLEPFEKAKKGIVRYYLDSKRYLEVLPSQFKDEPNVDSLEGARNSQANRLADATMEQLAYRLHAKNPKELLLDRMKFYEFYLSLPFKPDSEGGLFLADHKKAYDLPKDFMQHYEIRNPMPIVDLDIYPRGVILPSRLEEDIATSNNAPLSERIKAGLIIVNRNVSPIITMGKHGSHAFPSLISYHKLLRDEDLTEILQGYAKKGEQYFGFIRADFGKLKPRAKKPGWLEPKQADWIKSFPILIVPGISPEHLEIMVEKERKLLGLSK